MAEQFDTPEAKAFLARIREEAKAAIKEYVQEVEAANQSRTGQDTGAKDKGSEQKPKSFIEQFFSGI